MDPVGLAARPEFLDAIEAAHAEEVGKRFCYWPVEWIGVGRDALHRLAIVRETESGYYPITEDFFFGSARECARKAAELNSHRLDLSERDAARIVMASMGHQR